MYAAEQAARSDIRRRRIPKGKESIQQAMEVIVDALEEWVRMIDTAKFGQCCVWKIQHMIGGRLVVASAQWAHCLPSWLLNEIKDERWIILLKSLKGGVVDHEHVGDAEALAYLMTLSHRLFLPSGSVSIFEHLVREVLSRQKPDMPPIPPSVSSVRLTEREQEELRKLKRELYQVRGDVWQSMVERLE